VFGTHDAVASLQAGMEIEMPLRLRRARELPHALRTGRLDRATVLRAAHRILRTTLLHYATRDADEPTATAVASPEHRALARRVATESIVLLKNEPATAGRDGEADAADTAPLLPLSPGNRSIAVVGRLADRDNLGDHGSSRVRPPTSVSPLRGLREALPEARIVTPSGRSARAAAVAASRAEVAIVVVGLDQHDEGESVLTETVELGVLGAAFTTGVLRGPLSALVRLSARFVRGGDRRTLALRASDIELIEAVTAANPRTVVMLIGGSAILTQGWSERVPALAMAWYGGMEGGRALADVLTGASEPTGRLPFAIPTDPAHLPPFDRTALQVVYDGSWGQRKLDADGHVAAFPFGFGLGYTTLEHELISHSFDDAGGTAEVRVRNPGDREGTTVVQVYAADVSVDRPVSQLLGFQRVTVPAGGETVIQIELDATPTLQRDPAAHEWSPRPGEWALLAAQHSPLSWSGALPLRRARSRRS
jgi:beta-glucosidase